MTKGPLWSDEWMDLQHKYWEQWTQLQQQALGLATPQIANPWENALNHWSEAVSGTLPDLSRDFLQKMVDQGKTFFRMASDMATSMNAEDPDAWRQILDNLAGSFSRLASTADKEGYGSGFWEMPLDNWNRMVSALSPVPGDMLRGMPTTGFKENIDRILGAPGLGYTREGQEQYQSLFQSIMDYQEALAEYSLFFSRMGEHAALRLVDLVNEKPVESARGLYDTWVSCCEDEYATQVMTPEYAQLHGSLVNALMRVKHRWGELLNEYLSALNMPTQDDLRTLQRRVQEHRREIRTLRHELDELRKSMAGTRPAAKAAPKKKAAAKKTSGRKKTAAPRKKTAARKA
jgi:class III poly(R)-hydroxyalkanoic acid synthase PhaE subunit